MSEKRLSLKRPDSGKRRAIKRNPAVTHVNRELMNKNRELVDETQTLRGQLREKESALRELEQKINNLELRLREYYQKEAHEEVEAICKTSEFKIDRASDVVVDGVTYEKFRKATWFEWFVWGDCYYAPNRRKVIENKYGNHA